MKKIPVLMYHGIIDEPQTEIHPGGSFYSLTATNFREHLKLIKSFGYNTITFSELSKIKDLPPDPLIITFDDGERNNIEVAIPLLQEFGFKAVFFVSTDTINSEGYLTEENIALMSQAGMEIGSHGKTHQFLSGLHIPELILELRESKSFIEDITDIDVSTLSLPGGRGNDFVLETASSAGYKYVANSKPGYTKSGYYPLSVRRWAISKKTTREDIVKILIKDESYTRRCLMKYRFAQFFKLLINDKFYHRIWVLIKTLRGKYNLFLHQPHLGK